MDCDWVLLSLASAFCLATSDALTKRALSDHNEYLMAWLRLAWSLPPLCLALLFVPLPRIQEGYLVTFMAALPLEIGAVILYVKALKASPLSVSVPFLALTPIFLIVIPRLLLGETLSAAGYLGVVLIALGSYALNLSQSAKGIFEPLRAIRREPGARYMIAVALIYAVTSTLGKKAIGQSSPVFFGATYFVALTLCMTPVALLKGGPAAADLLKSGALRASFLPGLFYSLMILCHMAALSLTQVAYMISVKRLSLIIAVLYGYLLFRERGIAQRLFGATLMVAGFVLIVLYH